MNAITDFDQLFATSDDPWGFRTRWYEQRKRDLTLSMLPKRRYAHGFEPGCANGELTAALAGRCDRLLASDSTEAAVLLARARLHGERHVEVRQASMPWDWPSGKFDLIVVSELGYYLPPRELNALVALCTGALAIGGTLLACHWRRPIAGCELVGDGVHAAFRRSGLVPVAHHEEADFLLDAWSSDERSVAQHEGLA